MGFTVYAIISELISQVKEFINSIPFYAEDIQNSFKSINDKLNSFLNIFPNYIKGLVLQYNENIYDVLANFLGESFKSVSVNVIKKIPNAFMITIISIISCYLILIDKSYIEKFITRQIPKKYLSNIILIKSSIKTSILGYLKAQCIIMCLIAIISFFGLLLIQPKYALLIAVLIAVIDAIPIFGSGFILWPLSLYNFIIGDYSFSISLLVLYFIIMLTRQFIEPKIVGIHIGVHPLITLISIYMGLKLFGIFGLILGPIIVVTLKVLQKENIIPSFK